MKRSIFVALTFTLVLALSACGRVRLHDVTPPDDSDGTEVRVIHPELVPRVVTRRLPTAGLGSP